MMLRWRTTTLRLAAGGLCLVAGLGLAAVLPLTSTADPSLNQLNSRLARQQARASSLAESVSGLSASIASLGRQIALVQSREAAVRADLARDRAQLAAVRASLARARAILERLIARLNRARLILSRQLVSDYESGRPDLVSVVLNAHGFNDLLDKLQYLRSAELQQQEVIDVTRQAKQQADAAATRLGRIEASEAEITAATAVRARALAGMNELLQSKQRAVGRARAAQEAALAAARVRAGALQSQIARIQAAQAAAAAAAAAQSATLTPASTPGAPAVLGPSGGWAIPFAIVLCESGGQNLPPNTAGASGYYQIMPATWRLFGGSGPAAYLASKAEQDAVASRIWNGGAGASNWVCAGIVGIR
jgi:septal ring factor EnvC (AmiA/AmiB activator)